MRLTAFILLFLTLTPAFAQEGTWEGEVTTSRWPIFMTLQLDKQPSMTFLGRTTPITEVNVEDKKLRLVAGAVVLEGEIANDVFKGTLIEGEARLAFTFTRVPALTVPKDRNERWRQDLDALSTRFIRYDRSFSAGERARFLEKIESVQRRLPSLSDAEVMMETASAIAMAGNAHTRLYLLRNRTELRRLPVRLWWFRNELRVIRATTDHRTLLGCRVDDIAGVDVRHVRDTVSTAYAGNSSWRDYKSVYFMTSPEALRGFGITRDAESVEIGLSDCGGVPRRATVKPLPLAKSKTAVEAWWDLTPRHESATASWSHVLDGLLPLYLRNPNRYYWYEFLPQSGIFYVQHNRSSEHSEETLKAFGERLFADLAKHPVTALVVDLRFNTGGNLNLTDEFYKTLEERTRSLPRFVITGRATFSAGISAAAQWRMATNVKIVGEAVGDDLDFWAEGGNIILPNSGLAAHFSNGAHSYSTAPCPADTSCFDLSAPSLRPDIPTSSTWEEYRRGVDAAMREIERAIR